MGLLGGMSSRGREKGGGNFWEENQDLKKLMWGGEEFQVAGNFIHPWYKVINQMCHAHMSHWSVFILGIASL